MKNKEILLNAKLRRKYSPNEAVRFFLFLFFFSSQNAVFFVFSLLAEEQTDYSIY